MTFKFEIKFKESSSKNFEKILKLCNFFNDFEKAENKKELYKLTLDAKSFNKNYERISSILELIRNWKSAELYANDEKITFADIYTYREIVNCAKSRESSINNEKFCYLDRKILEGWGCKKLNSIKKYVNDNSHYEYYAKYWFEYGYFNKENIWVIDKNSISNILINDAEEKKIFVCNYFDIEKAKTIVNSLPDSIDIEKDDDWDYITEEIDNGITIEKIRTGIIPKRLIEDRQQKSINMGIRLNFGDYEDNEDEANIELNRNIPTVCFNDIGGLEEIIQRIREIIELPLKRPEIFKYLKIKPHKGILLYGNPGCGKTLIAKAIANEVEAHFISIKGPELLSKWHGQSEENLRNIFEEAMKLEPSIIFFDEIDSIAQSRSSEENLRLDSKFVNQLLTLMDGVEDYGNIRIIATTNRPELLDKALLRPGRFDYHFEIKKPTLQGCIKIFEIIAEEMPISPNFNKIEFAKQLFGLSGADIAFIVKESAYNCLRRNLDFITLIKKDVDVKYDDLIIQNVDFYKTLAEFKK